MQCFPQAQPCTTYKFYFLQIFLNYSKNKQKQKQNKTKKQNKNKQTNKKKKKKNIFFSKYFNP